MFISSYITSYHIGSKGHVKENLNNWMLQHSKDHSNMYNAINSVFIATNQPPKKFELQSLFFDVESIKSINDFIFTSNYQHNLLYSWCNEAGAALVNFNKPPIIIYPDLNPMTKLFNINDSTFLNKFLYLENVVHTKTIAAINNIYKEAMA